MKDGMYHAGPRTAAGVWNFASRYPLVLLEFETTLFLAASLIDFLMTWWLLLGEYGQGRVWFVESNPVARYCLTYWGIDGLLMFKTSMVVLVSVICQYIAHQRIDTARRVLKFATLIVTGVVIYSAALMLRAHGLGSV